jgi:hypothetical protein
VNGRKAHAGGRIESADGAVVYAESRGLFLAVPEFFDESAAVGVVEEVGDPDSRGDRDDR